MALYYSHVGTKSMQDVCQVVEDTECAGPPCAHLQAVVKELHNDCMMQVPDQQLTVLQFCSHYGLTCICSGMQHLVLLECPLQ